MCWSAPVSLVFGLVGIACAAFLFHAGREASKGAKTLESPELPAALASALKQCSNRISLPNYWSADCMWHALWVLNIACVELSEFVIWLNVLPFSEELQGGTTCPAGNKVGTFGVFIFGFANWSWIIAVWCHGTTSISQQPLRRKVFSLWRVFGIVVSLFFVLQLLLGEAFEVGIRYVANLSTAEIQAFGITRPVYYRFTTDVPLTFGTSLMDNLPVSLVNKFTRLSGNPIKTCSYQEVGKYPHLHWRFAWAEVPWLPSTGWTFFATMFFPFFFYKPVARAVIILAWGFFTYVIPILLLPTEETMSMF